MADVSNKSVYTDDELFTLDKLKNIRLKTIDSVIQNGIPDKVGELRILNELISSAEENIQSTASNRLKHQDNMSKDAVLDSMAEMLKMISKETLIKKPIDAIVILPDEYIPLDTVEGELEIHPEQLIVKDFIPGE